MTKQKSSIWLWLTAAISVLVAAPARAELVKVTAIQSKQQTTTTEVARTDIPRLSDIQHPYTRVKDWLAQDSQPNQVMPVTGIELKPTENGLEVILETPGGQLLPPTTSSDGNTLIKDIPQVVLALPEGNEFRANNPAEEITSVTVSQLDATTVRVSITGKAALPTAEVVPSESGLILSFTRAAKDDIEILVTGEREEGYRVEESTTGTKIPLPQRDIPQSIQVIPRQVIEDRQVVRLTELADNVSGVQSERGYGGISALGLRVRGFLTNFETLRNGFPDYGYFSPRDVSNVERFEVLKGPAAVLYGGSPTQYSGGGGVVNTLTEQPLKEPYYEANITIGSYQFYRPTLDLSGPLTSDESLLYRLNVAYENADSFRDFVEDESFFIAPVLTWNISPKTTLTAELNYQSYDFTFDQGFSTGTRSLGSSQKSVLRRTRI